MSLLLLLIFEGFCFALFLGKNFSEARRLTEEIKKLTSEGQLIQEEMEKLTQRNEETTKMVKLLREDVERIQEELDQDERQEGLWMETLRGNLNTVVLTILKCLQL